MENKDPHWVEPNDGRRVDVDLGDGHTLTWTEYKGVIVGGIIRHVTPKNEKHPNGYCDGSFWLKGNLFNKENSRNAPEWTLTGTFQNPTLSPSFDCHCKESHGFVRDGKWVRA